jgi:hypothetical protein
MSHTTKLLKILVISIDIYNNVISNKMSIEISFEVHLDEIENFIPSLLGTDYSSLSSFEAFVIIQNTIDQAFIEENNRNSIARKDLSIIVDSQSYTSTLHSKYITCTICTEDFVENDKVSQLLCNHIFHHSCIQEWCHYKDTCPVCRRPIKENND